MSATGRGEPRTENDFYPTPRWLTEAIVPVLRPRVPKAPRILEPACGTGAISQVIVGAWPNCILGQVDIAPADGVEQYGDVIEDSFLALEPNPRFDLVITNPPFSLAEEFIQNAHWWTRPGGLVVMMLRLGFAGGQSRAAWLRSLAPSVYVTPQRPKMKINKKGVLGSDASEYAWWVFDGRGEIRWLETEYPDDKKKSASRSAPSSTSL